MPATQELESRSLKNFHLITDTFILSTTLKNYSSQQNPASTQPTKVPDWKKWAYTDGSCQIHQGKRVTGAGTYHLATSTPSFVEPNRLANTNTINRAELAAITAVIFHDHSHIATDSISSLHKIRKHLLYPELHCHHVQGDILKILVQIIRNSPNPVHLL